MKYSFFELVKVSNDLMLKNYNKRKDNLIKYLEIIAEKTKNLSSKIILL